MAAAKLGKRSPLALLALLAPLPPPPPLPVEPFESELVLELELPADELLLTLAFAFV